MYNTGNEVCPPDATGQFRPQSLTERLKDEQKQLQKRYDEVTAVIESLEKAPETQMILDAVARLGHLNY